MSGQIDKAAADLRSVNDFIALSRLSPAEVLSLLALGKLAFVKGADNTLLIDISTIDPAALARTASGEQREGILGENLLEELVAEEIAGHFARLIEEALAVALGWLESEVHESRLPA